jgi:hypothetical protein
MVGAVSVVMVLDGRFRDGDSFHATVVRWVWGSVASIRDRLIVMRLVWCFREGYAEV